MSTTQNDMTLGERIDLNFPAYPEPGYREKQKQAIKIVLKAIEEKAKSVVVINAPTGTGKTLVLYTIALALGALAFCTSPQNSLVDQIANDDFIGDDVVAIKGRNNYDCIHDEDVGTSVDKAICQRDSDFSCELKGQCPYYGRKMRAQEHPYVVTNLPYLMAEGMTANVGEFTLGDRDLLIVDECQSTEDQGLGFISVTVSDRTVPEPVWANIDIPDEKYEDDMDYLVEWLQTEVLEACHKVKQDIDNQPILSELHVQQREKIQDFEGRVLNFLDDVENNHWLPTIRKEIKKRGDNIEKVKFEPVEAGRFLDDLLWSRADTVILSSATPPDLEEIGLGEELENGEVFRLNVSHTFPVENRPIIMDVDVGKMTYNKRHDNKALMAKRIRRIAEHHDGEKGFVHCRSYNMIDIIEDGFTNLYECQECGNLQTDLSDDKPEYCSNCGHTVLLSQYKWFSSNTMKQDRYNREESLQDWIDSDTQLFLSVAMDEGIDLAGDKCRFQILAKVLYKSTNDRRVDFRLNTRFECERCGEYTLHEGEGKPDGCEHCGNTTLSSDWDWYNRHAATQVQQAYGRGVRSPDDYCHFYILDSSAKGLIRRDAELFNEWFLEAIQGMKIDPSRGL